LNLFAMGLLTQSHMLPSATADAALSLSPRTPVTAWLLKPHSRLQIHAQRGLMDCAITQRCVLVSDPNKCTVALELLWEELLQASMQERAPWYEA
jgi:hypothetical protein